MNDEITVNKIAGKPHLMGFADFANQVTTSGAVNRFNAGILKEQKSYSVYLNGPLAEQLPEDAREEHYKADSIESVTQLQGLNRDSFRDNLRMAELITVKNAWMSAVLDNSTETREVSQQVQEDYEQLTNGLSHPWLQAELMKQQQFSRDVGGILAQTEKALGRPVADIAPDEVSRGTILAQNEQFTTQGLENGEVVTHENRRLEELPKIGHDITVTYYHGSGQIMENERKLDVTRPYIDDKTQDIGIGLKDEHGEVKQVVLFNGVSTFAKFVEAHGIDKGLLEAAIEAREAKPKRQVVEAPERKAVTGVYVDPQTHGYAIDYMENNQRSTLLFGSVDAMREQAKTFGITVAGIEQAEALAARNARIQEKTSLQQDEVRTIGPGKTINDARMFAATKFPGDYEKQASFMRAVAEKAAPEAVQNKAQDRDEGKER